MSKMLFELTDSNGIKWAGKRLSAGSPDVWLMYQYPNSETWTTRRKLEAQEIEDYQRMAGCYTRG